MSSYKVCNFSLHLHRARFCDLHKTGLAPSCHNSSEVYTIITEAGSYFAAFEKLVRVVGSGEKPDTKRVFQWMIGPILLYKVTNINHISQ
ncbi:hypothetical protein GDO78_011763 [Eleutherodactylus coqui]|uniref:Uncharacterized protein n=1 Tax=Eleutherodactylus coqui TaxID=57060 RepID=A0A8J6F3W2_ELECQ|nr:hypothetical protein GDO78_011763 [Eleutherodactylus coqui]